MYEKIVSCKTVFFCIENNDVSHETLCLLDFVEMDFA